MKKAAKLLAILLALGMILSLGACGFTNQMSPGALFGVESIQPSDYDSPTAYYQAVELANLVTKLQNVVIPEAGNQASTEGEFLLALDQSLIDPYLINMVTSEVGFDLSWFRSVGLGFLVGTDGDLAQENLTLRVNGNDIVHLETIMDRSSFTEYVAVPELNSAFIALNLLDLISQNTSIDRETLVDLLSGKIITPENITNLLSRYLPIIVNDIDKIEVAEGTVEAGGIESACYIATVTIDGETVLRLYKDVMTTALYDQELETVVYYIYRLTNNYYGTQESFHADYQARINDMLSDAEDADPEDVDGALIMDVFVDDAGKVLGRSLKVISEDELSALFSYVTAYDGNTMGVDATIGSYNKYSYTYEGETRGWEYQTVVSLSGSGEYNPADGSFLGDYLLSLYKLDDYNGDRDEQTLNLFDVNVNGNLTETGFLGEVVFTPTEDLMNLLLNSLRGAPQPLVNLLKSLTLAFVNRSGDGFLDCACILRSNGQDLLSLGLTANAAEPFPISVPTNVTDVDTWSGSIGMASLNVILNNLVAAGVPTEVLNAIMGG